MGTGFIGCFGKYFDAFGIFFFVEAEKYLLVSELSIQFLSSQFAYHDKMETFLAVP